MLQPGVGSVDAAGGLIGGWTQNKIIPVRPVIKQKIRFRLSDVAVSRGLSRHPFPHIFPSFSLTRSLPNGRWLCIRTTVVPMVMNQRDVVDTLPRTATNPERLGGRGLLIRINGLYICTV